MSVSNEARRLVAACKEKKLAHQALAEALDRELPLVCARVNDRGLVPFALKQVSWNVGTIGEQTLRIYVGKLEYPGTKTGPPKGGYSQKDHGVFAKYLLPAFVEELGIVGVFDSVEFFIDSHYLR